MRQHQILIVILSCAALRGQPAVAPTPERVGAARGDNVDGYNIVNSFETGYRFHSTGGSMDKYRSDVNYGNGLRLLSSQLTVHSREGHGRFFDEIVLSTLGLGNDPYQSSILRIGKNRLFRYDMAWRLNNYVNPGLLAVNGVNLFGPHTTNTTRRLQDHDLTLLPQSKIKFLLGYSRNVQDGPALSTIQLFDARGDEFPLFSDVRRIRNEYRLGGEIEFMRTKFAWLRGWDNFKEDTSFASPSSNPGFNTRDQNVITSFRRVEPYHGNSPYWRLNLIRDSGGILSISGRFSYAAGRRDFVFDESALGTNRFGAEALRQVLLFGSARRPVTVANLTLTLFPGRRFSVTNHTAFHHSRMEGDATYRELNLFGPLPELVHLQFLGIRTISNQTEATWRPVDRVSFVTGYSYSTRRIRSIEHIDFDTPARPEQNEQENGVHAGLLGFRVRPVKPLLITIDGEIGRAGRPVFPLSERNYHTLGARAQYRTRSLTFGVAARSQYNFNSVSLAAHSSRARNYSADASWAPRNWFALDAGYSKLHLDTLSAIAYFASSQFVERDRSLYVSNLHAINVGSRFTVMRRADIFLGYHRVQDRGDGRRDPIFSPAAVTSLPALAAAQTFPLAYQSPLGRVSIRLHEKIRLNFGYQYYGYNERFASLFDYRAHTGYTSVLWSF